MTMNEMEKPGNILWYKEKKLLWLLPYKMHLINLNNLNFYCNSLYFKEVQFPFFFFLILNNAPKS